MKKACENFGPDLLMLVHGELKGWQRMRIELHLAHCADCRGRRRKMGSLTVSLANAFQNPSLGFRTFQSSTRLGWMTMALALFLVSGGGWLTADAINHREEAPPVVASQGGFGRPCDEEPAHKAVALNKKKSDHPRRKHDNPDK